MIYNSSRNWSEIISIALSILQSFHYTHIFKHLPLFTWSQTSVTFWHLKPSTQLFNFKSQSSPAFLCSVGHPIFVQPPTSVQFPSSTQEHSLQSEGLNILPLTHCLAESFTGLSFIPSTSTKRWISVIKLINNNTINKLNLKRKIDTMIE